MNLANLSQTCGEPQVTNVVIAEAEKKCTIDKCITANATYDYWKYEQTFSE